MDYLFINSWGGFNMATRNHEIHKIVHICTPEYWEKEKSRDFYVAESLTKEGFIHCSRPDQLLRVANQYYSDACGLIVLWIDSVKLTAELKWEVSDGDMYPHLYGPLNMEAIISAIPIYPDKNGVFRELPSPD